MNLKILLTIALIAVIAGLYFVITAKNNTQISIQNTNSPVNQPEKISQPIGNAASRITKKSFGIKVAPGNSPVSPERFYGYHTGVDFETFASEQNSDVPIYAICTGPLLLKKWASGYGGVAVQKCKIDNKDVTVVYGHLKLASIATNTSQELMSGQQIGILGMGYSQETDGERKHLHLGIHKEGTEIDIRGYVQIQSELNQWIDFKKFLN